ESLQRFFVENNVIDVVDRESTVIKAEFNRLNRKSGVVFDSRKTFFLSSSNDLTVHHQGSGRIMEVGADPNNFHQNIRLISCMFKVVWSASFQPRAGVRCRAYCISENGGTTMKYAIFRTSLDVRSPNRRP